MGKTYSKEHKLSKAKDSHKENIVKRGGRIIEEDAHSIEYTFPLKGKAKKFSSFKKK